MDEQPVTDQEAEAFQAKLRKQADKWRSRLADPVIQQEIKAGRMEVSPLVKQLLNAFPPVAKK
jgi:hypothetical protein